MQRLPPRRIFRNIVGRIQNMWRSLRVIRAVWLRIFTL
jgi:hypothetical protein